MNEDKVYKVLKIGIIQKIGDKWSYPRVGDRVVVSEIMLASLISEGYLDPDPVTGKPSAVRDKDSQLKTKE